jgi:WD40 repeat protein
MRESQEPWLYSSVVSSDYDAVNRLAYTSSFDKTVKVWSIDEDAGTMRSILTWPHEGVVNFVAASKNGSGLIATAADVPNLAVRIYHVDRSGRTTACTPLAGLRSWNEDDQSTLAPQTWAYFPATMQWGISKNAQHLLLVGYSPRSLTGDDNDIPPEKRNSGEILLWDCIKNERCKVLTASTQNVFEVAWHPTQPCFVVATSPSGLLVKENVRTQIRLFRPSYNPDQAGAFSEVQCLDCPAIDINELTIVPNSLAYCYVTAAATDGCVYVWDTARGDDPVHRLQHGTPLEGDASEEHYNRERDDTGVKFTAWGTSLDRFYTGGSDGVVKVWNIRAEYKPLVRVILEAPAPISAGCFSPDKTKLAIGDATGRVYLFSVNEMEALEKTAIKLPPGFAGNGKPIRRPRLYTRHTTPAPPPNSNPNPSPTTGIALASRYLARGQIQISTRRLIGAVQGPAYPTLGLYREELHMDGSWKAPLLAHIEQQQQENMTMFKGSTRLPLLLKPVYNPAKDTQHHRNHALDLHLGDLPEETQLELRMAGVNLDDPIEEAADWGLEYEEA